MEGEDEIAKNDIISTHPNSRYATILLNPETILGKDESSPENIYTNLYKQFENQKYSEVISQCDTYITSFDGEDIVPKFEFLKAVSKARLYGYENYKESINFIALNYPNSPQGKKAEDMMQTVLPLLAKKKFVDDLEAKKFKAIYQFEDSKAEDVDGFIKNLDEAVENLNYYYVKTSKDVYNKNIFFVVVHGFKSIDGALEFGKILKDYKNPILKEFFAISSPNYQTIQLHKNLDEYLNPL